MADGEPLHPRGAGGAAGSVAIARQAQVQVQITDTYAYGGRGGRVETTDKIQELASRKA